MHYLRLSIATGLEDLKIGMERLEKAVADGSEVHVGATIYSNEDQTDVCVLEIEPWPAPEFKDVVLHCARLDPMRLPNEKQS